MGAHVSVPMYQRTLGQRYRLLAHRCTRCGTIYFPPKGVCRECQTDQGLEQVELSGRGTVYAVSKISAGGAPPEFAEQSAVRGDYIVAIVQLHEGPRIVAQLIASDPPEIGTPVEVVIRRIYTDEGVTRYGYKFRPAVASNS